MAMRRPDTAVLVAATLPQPAFAYELPGEFKGRLREVGPVALARPAPGTRWSQNTLYPRWERVDIHCFADPQEDAQLLYERVILAMYGMTGEVVANTQQVAGPLYRIDPQTQWRSVLGTWELRLRC